MKKSFKSLLAVILSVCILFSCMGTASAAGAADNSAIIGASNFVNAIINGALWLVELAYPFNDYMSVEEYLKNPSEDFLNGTEAFIDSPANGAKWRLGFGKSSCVPENLADGSKEYYTGGYMTQKINGVYDDQGVNAVALNDSSGRGTAVFAAVDAIGVSNADVRAIRRAVFNKLEEKGIKNDIIAININATHCHTVIDAQGFSLELIGQIFRNMLAVIPGIDPIRSIDSEFYDVLIDGASDAIINAYLAMEDGELYYFETAGVGRDDENSVYTDDEYDYLYDKRYQEEGFQHKIACFKFVPDNAESTPTVFSNLGAHPTSINRNTSLLSADFPHYMEERMNEYGYNFVFLQGAQCAMGSRTGNVKTQAVLDEVDTYMKANPDEEAYRGARTFGYELARLVNEAIGNAKRVDPMLNVDMDEVVIPLDRGIFHLAAASQLLGFTVVTDRSNGSKFSFISEVGYIELGSDIVILTAPGEIDPHLLYGNAVSSEEAYLGTSWDLAYPAETLSDKTVLTLGLCNDAIGYILADGDYAPFIADSLWGMEIGDWKLGEALFGEYHRHYEELLAAGGKAGSTVMSAINALIDAH